MAKTPAEFNEAAYLAANPDIAAAVKAGSFKSGLAHYQAHGQKEGRSASGGPPVQGLKAAAPTPQNFRFDPNSGVSFNEQALKAGIDKADVAQFAKDYSNQAGQGFQAAADAQRQSFAGARPSVQPPVEGLQAAGPQSLDAVNKYQNDQKRQAAMTREGFTGSVDDVAGFNKYQNDQKRQAALDPHEQMQTGHWTPEDQARAAAFKPQTPEEQARVQALWEQKQKDGTLDLGPKGKAVPPPVGGLQAAAPEGTVAEGGYEEWAKGKSDSAVNMTTPEGQRITNLKDLYAHQQTQKQQTTRAPMTPEQAVQDPAFQAREQAAAAQSGGQAQTPATPAPTPTPGLPPGLPPAGSVGLPGAGAAPPGGTPPTGGAGPVQGLQAAGQAISGGESMGTGGGPIRPSLGQRAMPQRSPSLASLQSMKVY